MRVLRVHLALSPLLLAVAALGAPADGPAGRSISWLAVALVIFGVVLLLAEAIAASGALGIAGLLFIALGGLLLAEPSLQLPLWAVLPGAIVFAGAALFLVVRALRIRRLRQLGGAEGLTTETGTATTAVTREGGDVLIHGEHWRAVADPPVLAGSHVRVRRVEGLTLFVEREPAWTT